MENMIPEEQVINILDKLNKELDTINEKKNESETCFVNNLKEIQKQIEIQHRHTQLYKEVIMGISTTFEYLENLTEQANNLELKIFETDIQRHKLEHDNMQYMTQLKEFYEKIKNNCRLIRTPDNLINESGPVLLYLTGLLEREKCIQYLENDYEGCNKKGFTPRELCNLQLITPDLKKKLNIDYTEPKIGFDKVFYYKDEKENFDNTKKKKVILK